MSTAIETTTEMRHAISLYVSNKPGVLNRIALVFSRRGFNIDSLVVSAGNDPSFSQMTIEATGNTERFDQILKHLNKLVDVIHAKDYAGRDVVGKELALIKLKCTSETRTEILQIGHVFSCHPVDMTESTITLQMTGDSVRLDNAKDMFDKFGILEMVRTGKVLMARGEEIT
jgi:acetolactate synthase-1/3 small subunit